MDKLYISDLDGTLLNSDQKVSEHSKELLNKLISDGLNFTIATARSFNSTYPLIKDINLKHPLILHNGVLIFDPLQELIVKRNTLAAEMALQVIKIMEKHGIPPFVFTFEETGNRVLYKELKTAGQQAFYKGKMAAGDKRFKQVDSFEIENKEIIMINSLANLDQLLPIEHALKKIKELNIHLVKEIYHDSWFIEITNTDASKETALKTLRELTAAKHVTCFGDNLNDIPLFKASDYRIAVKNGEEELKAKADIIIGTNNEDSVAKWIYSDFKKET